MPSWAEIAKQKPTEPNNWSSSVVRPCLISGAAAQTAIEPELAQPLQHPVHMLNPPSSTCPDWVRGECKQLEKDCGHQLAHRTFPVIVERASEGGVKEAQCGYRGGCWWLTDFCGFLHESFGTDGKRSETQAQRLEHRQILEKKVSERRWIPILRYRCKNCAKEFGSSEGADDHCESGCTGEAV